MERILGGKRYSTETATLLAHNRYWDGSNWERTGRNTYLYRTYRGRYFRVTVTAWQGERDSLEPLELEEALDLYEGPLTEHELPYSEAFPTVTVEDA